MDTPPSRPRIGAPITAFVAVALLAGACSSTSEPLVASSGSPRTDPPAAGDTEAQPPHTGNLTTGCVERFDDTVDYFPDKTEVRRAERLSISYEPGYKLVEVRDANFEGAEFTYVLVQCGTPVPELTGALAGATVIEVPVDEVVVMSTTILPGLDAIDRLDVLVGLDDFDFVQNERVRELIDQGRLARTGTLSFELDLETVVDLEPDVVMANVFGSVADEIGQLDAVGITAAVTADYRETTPLGRAEWMKLAAVLLNEEAAIDAVFDEVEAGYLRTAALVEGVEQRPVVLADAFNEFNGAWFAPGGDSYPANFIADAGGDYVFADQGGNESVPLDIEAVLAEAATADVWLNPGFAFDSLADLEAADPRHTEFAAFESGSVWNYILDDNGASNYFELGAARPDLVLADLVSILHPDLLPEHELVLHQRLR